MRKQGVPYLLSAVAIGVVSAMSFADVSSSEASEGAARSGLPSQLWQNVAALSIRCSLDGATPAQTDIICQRILAAAKINAPVDVRERAASAAPVANEVSLLLNGTVSGSDFIGTVGLSRLALRGEHDDVSRALPVKIDLTDKGSQADRSIHAAMVRLLPWRQLKRATHSPPREY